VLSILQTSKSTTASTGDVSMQQTLGRHRVAVLLHVKCRQSHTQSQYAAEVDANYTMALAATPGTGYPTNCPAL
jgi:hypothetical protein